MKAERMAGLCLSGGGHLPEIPSKGGSILFSRLFVRCRWWARIDPQNIIVSETRMNVNVQMRHLLECCFADGMPETESLVRECCADRAGDPHHGRHERRSGRVIQLAHVLEMVTRNNQGVTSMKLTKINECH